MRFVSYLVVAFASMMQRVVLEKVSLMFDPWLVKIMMVMQVYYEVMVGVVSMFVEELTMTLHDQMTRRNWMKNMMMMIPCYGSLMQEKKTMMMQPYFSYNLEKTLMSMENSVTSYEPWVYQSRKE